MNQVVNMFTKPPVTVIPMKDILTFIALYSEWLSCADVCSEEIMKVRGHIFWEKELEDACEKRILEFFLCDLIYISLSNFHVFDEFTITKNDEAVFTKYANTPIILSDYYKINLTLVRVMEDKDLSGVAFLLNILKEVVE